MEQSLRETLLSMSATMQQLHTQLEAQQELWHTLMRDIDRLYDIAAGEVESVEQDHGSAPRQAETTVDERSRRIVGDRRRRNRFNQIRPSIRYADIDSRSWVACENVPGRDENLWQPSSQQSGAMSGSISVRRDGERPLTIYNGGLELGRRKLDGVRELDA